MDPKRLMHYNSMDVQLTWDLTLLSKVPWYRRLWYRIRYGSRWVMKAERDEAQFLIKRFHEAYPGLVDFHRRIRDTAVRPQSGNETKSLREWRKIEESHALHKQEGS